MPDLKYRQQRIQEKRKNTPWREFVMEIGAWKPLSFYKIGNKLSVYAPNARTRDITDPKEFEVIRDNLFGIPFMTDFYIGFQQLWDNISLPGRLHFGGLENSAFTTTSTRAKNNYLTYNVSNVENIVYAISVKDQSVNVLNSIMVYNSSDTIYFSYAVFNGYKVFYSRFIHNSSNIRFSSNLINCQECLFCSELENASYCIHNKQYDKDQYVIEKQEILQQKNKFIEWFATVDRQGKNFGSHDCIGNCIIKSTNVHQSHSVYNLSDARNVYLSGTELDNQHMYDALIIGALGGNHYYGVVDIAGSEHIYSSTLVLGSSNIYYSYYLQDCSFCFGCIGLRNKSFCIFNKQYEKEEWLKKVNILFSQMDAQGILGNFLPAHMCPYYFNDTAAYLIDPSFTKEEVEAEGYMWRDEKVKVDIPEGVQIVKTSELNQFESSDENGNWKIDSDVLKKVIRDENGNVYRIVKIEYDFLMKHGLPLPRLHRLERLKMNFKIR